MALLDDRIRNRYTRDADTAAAFSEDEADWQQMDELAPLHAELLANNLEAKKYHDALTEFDARTDAEDKQENREEGVALAMQVATGLVAWATGKPGQEKLLTAMEQLKKSTLDKDSDLDYSQLISSVYTAAAPVKAALVKYFVPTAVTDQLGVLHAAFDEMRSDGRLTQTEAAAARKALAEVVSRNDEKKTGVYDRMKVYLKPFKYGNKPLYDRLMNVMQTVDRRGRKKAVQGGETPA